MVDDVACLGHVRVLGSIGHGSMGHVFLARHELLGYRIAIEARHRAPTGRRLSDRGRDARSAQHMDERMTGRQPGR